MSKQLKALAVLLLGVIVHAEIHAEEQSLRFGSGADRVTLLELYTSEGCNSCPPADRWLSGLKRSPDLWRTVVPVAFHVDYWDYIGWEDRFARPEYGERQSRYAAEGNTRFVYTPGLFRNGEDWQGWRRGDNEFTSDEQAGTLSVDLVGAASRCDCAATATINFKPASTSQDNLAAYVAILGMNRISKVDAGENVGKILRQDFVVLDLVSTKLSGQGGEYQGQLDLSQNPFELRDVAVIAWVAGADVQAPLQAAGISIPAAFEAGR